MNPPEEWDFARNNHLMDTDSERQVQNTQKIFQTVTILGPVVPNAPYLYKCQHLKNLNVKTSKN
jgi:hypothetical protein